MKFRAGDFSLDDAPQLGRPVEVDSNQTERVIENILKISKSIVIGENEKCVFYFTEKTMWTFWLTHYINHTSIKLLK